MTSTVKVKIKPPKLKGKLKMRFKYIGRSKPIPLKEAFE